MMEKAIKCLEFLKKNRKRIYQEYQVYLIMGNKPEAFPLTKRAMDWNIKKFQEIGYVSK